jgi:uncharacterized membrane protein (DUF485 family)
MEYNKPKNAALLAFLAVSIAPVLAFVVSNALFLPIALAMADFSNSFVAEMLTSVNNTLVSYFITAIFVVLVPITAVIVLISPPLTSFLLNRKHPFLMSLPRVIWSGVVFFFFHSILLLLLTSYRNSFLTPLPANYPFPRPVVDPLAIFGILMGFVMSTLVVFFGWLGTRRKRKALLISSGMKETELL